MKTKFYFLLMAVFVAKADYVLWGAPSEPSESVQTVMREEMESLRNHKKGSDPRIIVEKYGYSVVAALDEYTKDKDKDVRVNAYVFIDVATSKSTDVAERQNGVGIMLRNAFTDPDLKVYLLDKLLKYRSQDFSSDSLKLLRTKLAEDPQYRLILVVGVAGDKSNLEALAKIRDKAKWPLKPWGADHVKGDGLAFAAMMARARMGEKDDIRRCIELVDSYPDEDFKIRTLLMRLSYARQPEVVEYLKRYLLDNRYELGECEIKTTYAERAMMALSEMLEDFPPPLPKDKKFNSIPEITQYDYEWMSKQKEWKIIR